MISYYELLNMIKEEKAPKEIKYRGVIYKAMYDCDEFSYYYIKNIKEINEDCRDFLSECFLESDMFDKNIEIIDKIEKLKWNEKSQHNTVTDNTKKTLEHLLSRSEQLKKSINEIIDFLKSKGE